jgi:hypothetical protein
MIPTLVMGFACQGSKLGQRCLAWGRTSTVRLQNPHFIYMLLPLDTNMNMNN